MRLKRSTRYTAGPIRERISPRTARLWVLSFVLIITGVLLGRLIKAALVATQPAVESQIELHVG
jgi:hypothetical protein